MQFPEKIIQVLDLIYHKFTLGGLLYDWESALEIPKTKIGPDEILIDINGKDLKLFNMDYDLVNSGLQYIEYTLGLIRVVWRFDIDWDHTDNYPFDIGLFKILVPKTFPIAYKKIKKDFDLETSKLQENAIKIKIIKDEGRGIYRIDDDKLNYAIKSNSGRDIIVSYLWKNYKVNINKLASLSKKLENDVVKEIKEINNQIRNKLKVKDDFIIHCDTGGYSINTDKFKLEN